ncbi:MAG: class II fructose-1,6-bisphosphate aldolase [Bacilli bacterium]
MLVNLKEMMNKAKKNKYAIPQFNINNLEWTKYILKESEELKSPVILGVSESALKYMGGPNTVVSLIRGLIKDLNISIPVAIHLDHGSSFKICQEVINAGFTSVMIDASSYELEKNIKITKEVVLYAHQFNVTVEGEIGGIGGIEDDASKEICYARVNDCIAFVKQTNVDLLAPALGSVHGFYQGEPDINFERMKKISEKTNIPLVLHGGTGIPNDDIIKAIKCGTTKINVNTELQFQWAKGVKHYLEIKKDVYDPRKIIGSGELNLKKVVRDKIILFRNN